MQCVVSWYVSTCSAATRCDSQYKVHFTLKGGVVTAQQVKGS